MSGLWMVLGALGVAMVGSELVLGDLKLQSAASRLLAVWVVVWVGAAFPALHWGGIGPLTFGIFWGGAFLSWFGVRSHIESSILLRMLHSLRKGPMNETQIVDEYTSSHGEAERAQELLRGGLTSRNGGSVSVTAKGKSILRIVEKLR